MSALSPEARKLFAAARSAFTPDDERIERVGAAVATKVALTASGAAIATSAAKASAAPTGGLLATTKIAGIALVAGAAGLTAVALPRPEPPTAPPPAATHMATRAPAEAAVHREPASPPLPSEPDLRPPPALREPPSPPPAARSPSGVVASPAPARVVLEETQDPAPRPSGEPADSLAAEVALVRAARAALDSGDAARTLALTAEHAARHPRGALAQERLALRALALCALGRTSAARAATADLERASPRSPHLERLRAGCSGGATPPNSERGSLR